MNISLKPRELPMDVGVLKAGAGVAEGLGEELVFGLEAVDGEDDVARLFEVGAVTRDVGGDAPVVQLRGGVEEDVVGGWTALEDLEEPGGEDRRYVWRKAAGGGVDLSAIRALTRTLASCEAFDLGEVFAASTDPARLEVDPLFHRDLEVRGAADIGDVPLRWRVFVPDGILMYGKGFLQALNAASKWGLVVRRFLFALGDGGAEAGNEFSEGVLRDVVKGQEGVDCGAWGDGISRLYIWHPVGGTRVRSRFVKGDSVGEGGGVHVTVCLQ
jgi:hypothetical protein